MKVEKPRLQIVLIVIVLDLPVGIDAMPYTRASKLKLKESRHSKINWHEYGSNSPVGSSTPEVFGPKQVNTLILL
ncbi:MAG: hypothetical protein FIO03_04940 [Nitrosopumilales archaeon]|nr:hypothetical protein [Nitrosopumilales archaeon]